MGFLDDVLDNGFVKKLGETLQDTGWFIGAPVATAFDLARAGFSDDITVGGALAQGINRGTQLFLGDSKGTQDRADDTPNLLSPGVNKVMDGIEWLYDNALAQPLNTANITEQRIIAGLTGTEDNAHPWDLGSAWARADETTGGYGGKGTSIGRESAYTWDALVGLITGYRGSLTDEGQRMLDEHSKMFDVQSGVADFTSRLFLDPTIVLGKAAKALKFTAFIRGIRNTDEIVNVLKEDRHAGGLFDGFGQRVDAANEFNMGLNSAGVERSADEIVAANKGLQDASGDGWAIAQAMESANKQLRAAGATEDEILQVGRNISLAGIGDPVALKNIGDNASAARDALANLRSQRDDLKLAAEWATKKNGAQAMDAAGRVADKLGLAEDVATRGQDYLASDEFLALTGERLKAIQPAFQAAQREAARSEKLANMFRGEDSLAGALADRPLLAGVRSGTKGMERRANKAAGLPVDRAKYNPARLDFVFQTSAWNKAVKYKIPQLLVPHIYYGVKAHQLINRVQAPRAIDMHDENAPMSLNNFLKQSFVDPLDRQNLVSQMAAARTEDAKAGIVRTAVANAQASMIRKYMKDNPHFTEETARTVIAEQAKQIQQEAKRIGLQTQKFTAHLKDDGTPGDVTLDENGLVSYQPLLETQRQNMIVLPDLKAFTKILDRHSGWVEDMAQWVQGNRAPDPGRVEKLADRLFQAKVASSPGFEKRLGDRIKNARERAWQTEQFMTHALDGLNKMWKFAVLLRPAYPMRVLIDSDLRALSVLGPAAFGMHFAPRAFGFATMGSASRVRAHYLAKMDDDELNVARAMLEQFEDKWKAEKGDLPIDDEQFLGLRKKAQEIEDRLDLYRSGRKGRIEAYGRFGDVGQTPVETAVGLLPGAFADDYGRMQRFKISSKTTAALLGDSQKTALGHLLSESWTSLDPSDKGHMEAWLHGINAQLKQSEIGKAALKLQVQYGDDPEKAVRALMSWGRNTQIGRDTLKSLPWTAADREGHAREVIGFVNHYLPTPELRRKALEEKIGRKDLESAFPDPLARPPVHGQALSMSVGRGNLAGRMLNQWFDRTMKWLSDAPEDQLARHPMYAAVYEQEAKRQAELLQADPNIKDVSLSEIQTRVQKAAHKKAARAIKTYMFDVAAQSDLSHALRFVSPFIAAWEDTIKKWGRIAADDPSILGKGYLAWNMPNDMGMVVDQDGKPVANDDFNDNDFMILQVPTWSPFFAGKKITALDTQFRIPKQAMNIVLQGGLQPGFGPLVAVPVGMLQTSKPEINDVAKFVNPFGPPDSVWDAVAPATVKRITELTNEQSKAHMADSLRIYQQMNGRHRLDPERYPAPTWAEAEKRAKHIGVLKIANNFANPFPAIFDSPYKLYQDAYRDLKEKERTEKDENGNQLHPRGWADEQFIKGYGESFFPLVQGMSKNNAGLSATAEGKNASDRYAKQISKYGMENGSPNKTLIQLIVGDEGEGEFNLSAHRWQETREISPASGVDFRSTANAQDAAADADSALGWYKFRQFMNQMDAMANDRGLRTYSEDPELVQTRKDFIQQLKDQNPAWEVDFDQMDPEKFNRNIEKLGELANSDTFGPMRTDMAGTRQYLALRKALTDQLEALDIGEGTQAAIPYKVQFTDAVMDLVGSNTKFAEWAFHPFLERDPLLEGLITDPTTGELSLDDTAATWGFS